MNNAVTGNAMTHCIEDFLDLIDAIVRKYTRSREPVRDRIEWSVACEAFMLNAYKYDPAKSHNPGRESFCMWVTWIVRRRLIDFKRSQYGRKGEKCQSRFPLGDYDGHYPKVEEQLEYVDLVQKLPEKQYKAILHFLKMEVIPTQHNGGNYYDWTQAVQSLKGMME